MVAQKILILLVEVRILIGLLIDRKTWNNMKSRKMVKLVV